VIIGGANVIFGPFVGAAVFVVVKHAHVAGLSALTPSGRSGRGIPVMPSEPLVQRSLNHLATRLADHVYVLSQGQVQFAGDTQSLIANEDVRRTYLCV
jgi:ABC-type branched-subunit amino acid transport system permease subunit